MSGGIAMETALLGLALPTVLERLKEILIRKGFMVQTMPTHNPVIVAYKEGKWFRPKKKLVIEIISVDKNLTRIDITAILENKKSNPHEEEMIEESFASQIYRKLKNNIDSPAHGV